MSPNSPYETKTKSYDKPQRMDHMKLFDDSFLSKILGLESRRIEVNQFEISKTKSCLTSLDLLVFVEISNFDYH